MYGFPRSFAILMSCVFVAGLLPLLPGCTPPETTPPPRTRVPPRRTPPAIEATAGNQVMFKAKWDTARSFYHFPAPSDLRLTADGAPDVRGFPNDTGNEKVLNVLSIVPQHKGYPLAPIAYFQFQQPLAPREASEPILAKADAPALLIDVDPSSPKQGTLYPVVAAELPSDGYVPKHLLAVGVYPGTLLHQDRTYAFVVMRSYKDAKNKPLGVPKILNQLKAGQTPEGDWGKRLKALYDPLWKTLEKLEIPSGEVAAATVFTTGAVIHESERISSALRKKHTLAIEGLKLDPTDGDHDRYCELMGTITVPIFQEGEPPYNSKGMFAMGNDGLPVKQRDKRIPIVITLPKKPMPSGGYPLMMYIHGSGGKAAQVVDRGPRVAKSDPRYRGHGPAHVIAAFGLAAASMAMPLAPERVPGANPLAYFNLGNLKIFRDTYRQGVIEVRLYLDALLKLKIPPSVLGACKGPQLPQGQSAFFFSPKRLTLMGQSMGGTYSNLVASIEPRFKAVVPTGTGGYWGYFAYQNNLVFLSQKLVGNMLDFEHPMTHLHPVLHVLETAWEAADPYVHSAYLARRKLKPEFPVRSIYEPVGLNDSYFTTTLLDLMAAGYGNQQAGGSVWPGMETRFAVLGLGGKAKYPVKLNRKGPDGTAYTGVVVQYEPDASTKDGHIVAFQLDAVKYQYGCFLSTFVKTGVAVVPAPAAPGTPCPE